MMIMYEKGRSVVLSRGRNVTGGRGAWLTAGENTGVQGRLRICFRPGAWAKASFCQRPFSSQARTIKKTGGCKRYKAKAGQEKGTGEIMMKRTARGTMMLLIGLAGAEGGVAGWEAGGGAVGAPTGPPGEERDKH